MGEKQRYKLDYGLKQLARGLSVFSGTKWFRHHPDRTPGRLRGPNDFLQWALKDDEEYCNITTADIIGLRHELSLLMEPGTSEAAGQQAECNQSRGRTPRKHYRHSRV